MHKKQQGKLKTVSVLVIIFTVFILALIYIITAYDKETENNTVAYTGKITNIRVSDYRTGNGAAVMEFMLNDDIFYYRWHTSDRRASVEEIRKFADAAEGKEVQVTCAADLKLFQDVQTQVVDIRDSQTVYVDIDRHNRKEAETFIALLIIWIVMFSIFCFYCRLCLA